MRFHIFIFISSFLTLSACSHVQYVSSDKQQKTVAIQGGRHNSLSDAQDLAEKHCEKPNFFTMVATKDSGDSANNDKNEVREPDYIYTFKCVSLSQN